MKKRSVKRNEKVIKKQVDIYFSKKTNDKLNQFIASFFITIFYFSIVFYFLIRLEKEFLYYLIFLFILPLLFAGYSLLTKKKYIAIGIISVLILGLVTIGCWFMIFANGFN